MPTTITYRVQSGSDDGHFNLGVPPDTSYDYLVLNHDWNSEKLAFAKLTPVGGVGLSSDLQVTAATLRMTTKDAADYELRFADNGAVPIAPTTNAEAATWFDAGIATPARSWAGGGARESQDVTASVQALFDSIGSGNVDAILVILDAPGTDVLEVHAYDKNSADAIEIEITAAQLLPPAPEDLTATAVGIDRIDLAWTDAADNEAAYEIERSTNGAAWVKIATVPPGTEAYTDDGLPAGTHFWYRVRGTNSHGAGDYSGTAEATTEALAAAADGTPNVWRGDAPAVARVLALQITQVLGGQYGVRVRWTDKAVTVHAEAGQQAAAVADALLEAIQDADIPELQALSVERDGDTLTFTGQPGEYFELDAIGPGAEPTARVTVLQSGVLPISHEITLALPATTTGGSWTATFDFGSGDETTAALDWDATTAEVAAAIEALATPEAGDITVTLDNVTPRTYRVQLGGSLAGTTAAATVDATALLGNATAELVTVQTPGASVPGVWGAGVNAGTIAPTHVSIDGGASWLAIEGINSGDSDTTRASKIAAAINAELGDLATASVWVDTAFQDLTGLGSQIVVQIEGDDLLEVFDDGADGQIVLDLGAGVQQELQVLQTPGGASSDEWQLVEPNGASYTLTFDGQTTGTMTHWNQVKAALEALPNVGSGNVDGWAFSPSNAADPFLVRFTGSMAATPQPLLECSDGTVSRVSQGQPLVNQRDRLTLTADGGTFTLTADGDTTAAIPHGTTAAAVQTALETARGTADFSVQGAGTPADPYFIEYVGTLAQTAVTAAVDATALEGGQPGEVATAVQAVPGVNAIQRIELDQSTIGGTWRAGLAGGWTDAINWDASPDDVQAALEGASTIPAGGVTVDGTAGGPYLVEFTGVLGWQPMPTLKVDPDELLVQDRDAVTLSVQTAGSGPSWWNVDANWTLGHVPRSGEIAALTGGDQDIRFGLRQRAVVDVAAGSTTLLAVDPEVGADFVEGCIVRLRSTGTLPTATAGGVAFELDSADLEVRTFDPVHGGLVVGEPGGPVVKFTSAGTGTLTVEVQLRQLRVHQRYGGLVGLPQRDDNGVWESRPRYLQIGFEPPANADAENLQIGLGDGSGSGRLQIDVGASQMRAAVVDTGGEVDTGVPAVLLVGTNTNNELLVIEGSVGVAFEAAQTAVVEKLRQRGGVVQLGRVALARIDKTGGELQADQATLAGALNVR